MLALGPAGVVVEVLGMVLLLLLCASAMESVVVASIRSMSRGTLRGCARRASRASCIKKKVLLVLPLALVMLLCRRSSISGVASMAEVEDEDTVFVSGARRGGGEATVAGLQLRSRLVSRLRAVAEGVMVVGVRPPLTRRRVSCRRDGFAGVVFHIKNKMANRQKKDIANS